MERLMFVRNRSQTSVCSRGRNTKISSCLLASVALVLQVGIASAQQYPLMEKIAGGIIQKYQSSSCEQLWQEKAQKQGKPKSEMEQKAIGMLRNDPQMRGEFINRIAAPIANKMFECGMVP